MEEIINEICSNCLKEIIDDNYYVDENGDILCDNCYDTIVLTIR